MAERNSGHGSVHTAVGAGAGGSGKREVGSEGVRERRKTVLCYRSVTSSVMLGMEGTGGWLDSRGVSN